jgi:ECF sigma factor
MRVIALCKMEGYTNSQIADKLNCARSTIQRKLTLIQACWEQVIPEPPPEKNKEDAAQVESIILPN